MQPEILSVLSYFMGLILVFQTGVLVGGVMQRRMIMNTFATGLKSVENLFSNLFRKGAKDAKEQDFGAGSYPGHWDSLGVLNGGWQEAEEIRPAEDDRGQARTAFNGGLGDYAGENPQGTGQQGGEGLGGGAGREEEGEGSGTR